MVVADGRGTPGRSPAWEKAVRDDLAAVVLAGPGRRAPGARRRLPARPGPGRDPRLVLRRLSGGARGAAPPRRLPRGRGRRPGHRPAAVRHPLPGALPGPPGRAAGGRTAATPWSTTTGLVDAAEPHRPMMIIHGLADDNVVVAHSLRLSSALLAAGRPHEVLPLSGVTHMTPQETGRREPAAAPAGLPGALLGWAEPQLPTEHRNQQLRNHDEAPGQVRESGAGSGAERATGRSDMARSGPFTAPARPYVVQPDASVYRDRVGQVACLLTRLTRFARLCRPSV